MGSLGRVAKPFVSPLMPVPKRSHNDSTENPTKLSSEAYRGLYHPSLCFGAENRRSRSQSRKNVNQFCPAWVWISDECSFSAKTRLDTSMYARVPLDLERPNLAVWNAAARSTKHCSEVTFFRASACRARYCSTISISPSLRQSVRPSRIAELYLNECACRQTFWPT